MPDARRLIFLDRDGTLIRYMPYLCEPQHVALLPDVRDGIAKLKKAGHLLFLHTNQSGVGRGYFPLEKALSCNDRMIELLDFKTSPFEKICVATDHPDAPLIYRKPSPRFALEMAEMTGISPTRILYIGDAPSDLLTAMHAGGNGIGVNTGDGTLPQRLDEMNLDARFLIYDRFGAAVSHILTLE